MGMDHEARYPSTRSLWGDEFRQINVCGRAAIRPFPLQVRLHHAHLPNICAQQDLPPIWWKWSENVCDNMQAARGGNMVEGCEIAFRGHKHAHNPQWLRRLQRCERAYRRAGKSSLFCSTYRHQCLGADPEDDRHKSFFQGERGGDHSLLNPLSQDHERDFGWLRWQTLSGWIQRSDFKAERAKILLSRVLASPPLRGKDILNKKM